MKIRKCDRCGKIFEGLASCSLPDRGTEVTHMSFIGKYYPELGKKQYVNKDLCQSCLQGLVDYIYGYGKDTETTEYHRRDDLANESW